MVLQIEVVAEDPNWAVLDLPGLCERAGAVVADQLALVGRYGAVVLAASDARIAVLNAQFRAKHQATNVLSWPQQDLSAAEPGQTPRRPQPDPMEEETALGDIALAFETCRAEAEAVERPFEHHVSHLVVHGLLHLLGYDHIRDIDGDLMETREVEILSLLGVPDPYIPGVGT